MKAIGRDPNEVLRRTREVLETTRWALYDISTGDPRRRRAGVWNLLTYGRNVTFVLQTMRGIDETFDDWYVPWRDRMKADPLMTYMVEQRNALTKEGFTPTSVTLTIGADGPVDLGELMRELNANAPSGARSTFLGDHLGGNGWEVERSDGTVDRIYFDLPETSGVLTRVLFVDPPVEHNGQPIEDPSITHLAELYVAFLDDLVADAEHRFGGSSP